MVWVLECGLSLLVSVSQLVIVLNWILSSLHCTSSTFKIVYDKYTTHILAQTDQYLLEIISHDRDRGGLSV